jgi:hypothetical protein
MTRPSVEGVVGALDSVTAEMAGEGKSVQLLLTLAVPNDEVLYGVFTADTPELVSEVCTRAGIPIARLSTDVDARLSSW